MAEVPAQPQPQVATTPKPTNWKKIGLTVLIILVVTGLIAGVYWFFILDKSSDTSDLTGPVPKPQVTTSTPSATPSAKKDETTDWKVYQGEVAETKFSLKYPSNLNVVKNESGGGAGVFYYYFFSNIDSIDFMNYKNGDFQLEVSFRPFLVAEPGIESMFAGFKAEKKEGKDVSFGVNSQVGLVRYNIINGQPPMPKGLSFVFACRFAPLSDESLKETCETIASTFKFLD